MTANICATIIRPGIIKSFKYEKLGTQINDNRIKSLSKVIIASNYIKRISKGKPVAVKGNIISYNEKLSKFKK